MLVCWINGLNIKDTSATLGINVNTISSNFATYRERIVAHQSQHVVKFDPSGGEYEVDEFLVKNCHDGWHKCCWVAGIVERGSNK